MCLVTRQHKIYVSFTGCQVNLVINYIDMKVSVGGINWEIDIYTLLYIKYI